MSMMSRKADNTRFIDRVNPVNRGLSEILCVSRLMKLISLIHDESVFELQRQCTLYVFRPPRVHLHCDTNSVPALRVQSSPSGETP